MAKATVKKTRKLSKRQQAALLRKVANLQHMYWGPDVKSDLRYLARQLEHGAASIV